MAPRGGVLSRRGGPTCDTPPPKTGARAAVGGPREPQAKQGAQPEAQTGPNQGADQRRRQRGGRKGAAKRWPGHRTEDTTHRTRKMAIKHTKTHHNDQKRAKSGGLGQPEGAGAEMRGEGTQGERANGSETPGQAA